MIDRIQQLIEQAIPGATATVTDPNQDGMHFSVVVVSPSFEGQAPRGKDVCVQSRDLSRF